MRFDNTRTTTTASWLANFEDTLDLDRDAFGKTMYANRRSRVTAFLEEDLHHQIRASVDNLRVASKRWSQALIRNIDCPPLAAFSMNRRVY